MKATPKTPQPSNSYGIKSYPVACCGVFDLSHMSEAERVPQIREMMQELRGNKGYNLIMGDFNALSPEDGIPQSAVDHFSDRMKEKYCKDGKLCFDTVETVL